MLVVSKRQTVNLTMGKVYRVLESPGKRYTIINDRGQLSDTSVNNFIPIEEARESKLNKLFDEK